MSWFQRKWNDLHVLHGGLRTRRITTLADVLGSMQVREIMTDRLATIPPDASLHDAIGVMLAHRIGSVLVVDTALEGICTRSDLLKYIYENEGIIRDTPITELMSSEVLTTSPTQSVSSALLEMAEHDVKRLPVRDGLNIVGIITLTDIAHHLPDEVREIRRESVQRNDWTD